LRSSGVAGMLMFVGASLLVSLLGLLSSGSTLFYDRFSQPGLAFLIVLGLLGVIGMLRGMLDAWVYHRIITSRKNNSIPE